MHGWWVPTATASVSSHQNVRGGLGVTVGQQGQQLGRETQREPPALLYLTLNNHLQGVMTAVPLCLPNLTRPCFWPTRTLDHSEKGILGNTVPSVNESSI